MTKALFTHNAENELVVTLDGRWDRQHDLAVRKQVEQHLETGHSTVIKIIPGDDFIWDADFPAYLHGLSVRCAERDQTLDVSSMPQTVRQLYDLATAVPVIKLSRRMITAMFLL